MSRDRVSQAPDTRPICWRLGRNLTPVPSNPVTVREVIKLIEADGWYLDRQRSSHRQFKHPTKPGLVTVAGHPPKVLAPKTLRSILRQAGLEP